MIARAVPMTAAIWLAQPSRVLGHEQEFFEIVRDLSTICWILSRDLEIKRKEAFRYS